ncbi:MAG: hypothetical protein GY950_13085 [bacterium]|nr:hypothetical protein [bacterium]
MKKEKTRAKVTGFRGAAVASLLMAFVNAGFYGANFQSGIGPFWEFLIGISVCAVGVSLLGLLHALFMVIGRQLPRMFRGDFFAGLGAVFKALPIPSASLIWGSAMFVFIYLTAWSGIPGGFAFLVGPFIIILAALLGGAVGYIMGGGFRETHIAKKILVSVSMVLIVCYGVYLVVWLTSEGSDQHLVKYETFVPPHLEKLDAPDPSQPGTFKVNTLIYGSGTDIKRPEYGEGVTIKTKPVDASVILKGYKGFKAKTRTWYWGFDIKQLPVNGRVWYPEGSGPFPLVLVVHGNHNMNDFSDPGYAYLGELLASQGFITVSVDENFFNGGFSGGIPSKKSENATRGWMLLKHLETWKSFNETEGNVFFGKVAMTDIALIGHSRGGDAVALAAAENRLPRFTDDGNLELGFNFDIKTVIAIAPVDGQYRFSSKPLPLEDVNYFSIQGGHDADMHSFHGNRQYQRVRFSNNTGQNYYCKSTLYVYRANHGQFNTVWGNTDMSAPAAWFLNLKPLLPMEEQLKISKFYISGFLQVTLQNKKEYLPMFRNHRTIAEWLPKTLYVNRFEDSTFQKLTDFEEDINLVTTSVPGGNLVGENLAVWSEDRMTFRTGGTQENHVARLGWRSDESDESEDGETEKQAEYARYVMNLSEGFAEDRELGPGTFLVFSMADSGEKPPVPDEDEDKNKKEDAVEETAEEKEKDKEKEPLDLTLELVDSNGVSVRLPLSYFSTLHPPLKSKMTKWGMMESAIYRKDTDPLLETFEFPLSAFKEVNPAFELRKLVKIVFLFDRSKEGVIYLDDIGTLDKSFAELFQKRPAGGSM